MIGESSRVLSSCTVSNSITYKVQLSEKKQSKLLDPYGQIKLITKHRDISNCFIFLHANHYSYAVVRQVVSIFHFWPRYFFLRIMCGTKCKAPFSDILYID